MDLAGDVWTLCAIIHRIGLVSWDHNLVSNAAVVVFTMMVFNKVILVNKHLSFVSKMLQIDNDWNR